MEIIAQAFNSSVDSRAPPLSCTSLLTWSASTTRYREDCKGQVTYEALNGIKYTSCNETTVRGCLSTVFNTIHNTIYSQEIQSWLSLVSLVWAGPRDVHRNKFTLLEMKVFLFYIFAKSSIPLKLNTKNLAMIPEELVAQNLAKKRKESKARKDCHSRDDYTSRRS